MRFYAYLQLSAWQELSDDKKIELFKEALKPTFESRHDLSAVYLVNLKMGEASCRTLAIELANQTFYFLPGQTDVTLGIETTAKDSCLKDQEKAYSSLRTVTIEPMFVARDAQTVGVNYRGSVNVVTGDYHGEHRDFFELNQKRIKKELFPNLSFEESLNWEYAPCFLARNLFLLEQDPSNLDNYELYAYDDTTYSDIWLEVYSDGFQLLSEDAWEYVFAEKQFEQHEYSTKETVLLHDNTYELEGLIPEVTFNVGNNPEKCELLAETGIIKQVPYNTETGDVKSVAELAKRVTEAVPKSNAPLAPNRFNYREAIVFSLK